MKYAEVGLWSCLMWLHFKITREWQSTSQVEQRFCRILIFIALTWLTKFKIKIEKKTSVFHFDSYFAGWYCIVSVLLCRRLRNNNTSDKPSLVQELIVCSATKRICFDTWNNAFKFIFNSKASKLLVIVDSWKYGKNSIFWSR